MEEGGVVGCGWAGNVLFTVFTGHFYVGVFFGADNKALTNEESRCQARVSVMYALVTKAPPNEDESQYAPRLPRKHLYVWLHYQTL